MLSKIFNKKWAAIALASTMMFGLIACGDTTDETDNGGNGVDQTTDGGDNGDNGDNGDTDPSDDTPDDEQLAGGEEVTITYINWNLGTEEDNNMERRMIQAYMEKHENVTVEIADFIDTSDYNTSLTNAAAGGRLPDVFMLSNVPFGMNGDWLLDIADIVAEDEEWSTIADPVIGAVNYGSHTYAVPAGQFLAGLWVNTDLFAETNTPQPKYGYTLEEFDNAVVATTNLTNGTLGLENEINLADWYPYAQNNEIGWFTWDGTQYNLDSPEFAEAINKAKSYFDNKQTFDALTEEERAGFNGANAYEVWMAGDTAMKYDGSWMTGAIADFDFTLEFIGLPGGSQVIIGDYMGINKDSAHADVAYDFTKWMTFSTEGQLKRMEITEETGQPWSSMPITSNQDVLDAYFAVNRVAGLEEAYENLDNSVVEQVKTVPGFGDSRWNTPTGVSVGDNENASIGDLIFQAIRGDIRIEDYADQLNDLANGAHDTAVNAITAPVD